MVTYVLVWIIGVGSLGLYLAAYLFPEVHRKNDFIWGGVGLFYALILWANAKTIPGGLLVGQIASVSLIVWLGQQTLRQRASLAPPDAHRPEPGSVSGRLRGLMIQAWRLIEPPITLVAGFIAKALEKPQEAEIAEIETGVAEEAKPSFINQLTDPLSNLSGNLTGLFQSGQKGPQTISTVNVKATPAPEERVESKATSVVESEPQKAPENLPDPGGIAPAQTVEAEVSPPEVKTPQAIENSSKPQDTSSLQKETSAPPITVEVPMKDTEVPPAEPTREVHQVSEDTPPEATQPIDPQSALPPVEIEADRAFHSSETPSNMPISAEDVSETENSDATENAIPAETSAEAGTPQAAINSGALQPEEKPEEWTTPDPLA